MTNEFNKYKVVIESDIDDAEMEGNMLDKEVAAK